MPLITPEGVVNNDAIEFLHIDALQSNSDEISVDLDNDVDATTLKEHFHRIPRIRIAFPSTADGRGFSLAKSLRNLGYNGKLRAQGSIISDQYRYMLDCGFDEVETSQEIADRQPAEHWSAADNKVSYREKFSKAPASKPLADNLYKLPVIDVEHYSDSLFRFRVEPPESFRFTAGVDSTWRLHTHETKIYRLSSNQCYHTRKTVVHACYWHRSSSVPVADPGTRNLRSLRLRYPYPYLSDELGTQIQHRKSQ